ncbi:hypothetical protein K435DRAFT_844618 [Dendrothele bispora CBS 962.96]|uniref:Uncharacterized protein n=1 Tax=Dendrothele bispora (strain CBS 962.96) TaxID=1314807 RepID=A0A4S8L0M0_DENBC|nr:hypothetical protein K435DRAFT_844618 [Dendrothele bispora CBS 962.96]
MDHVAGTQIFRLAMSSASSATTNSTSSTSSPTSLHADTKERNRPPTWLSVTLAALTVTATVVIPGAILLRRRHSARLPGSTAPAPTRRVRTSAKFELDSLGSKISKSKTEAVSVPSRSSLPSLSGVSVRPATGDGPTALSYSGPTPGVEASTEVAQKDGFSPILHALKALGVATVLVSTGAVAGVWGVKSYLGVKDTQEFAERMHGFVSTRIPVLSVWINRSHFNEDDDCSSSQSASEVDKEWTWPEAEDRLRDAYSRGGATAWIETALKEMEDEVRSLRRKRDKMEDESNEQS